MVGFAFFSVAYELYLQSFFKYFCFSEMSSSSKRVSGISGKGGSAKVARASRGSVAGSALNSSGEDIVFSDEDESNGTATDFLTAEASASVQTSQASGPPQPPRAAPSLPSSTGSIRPRAADGVFPSVGVAVVTAPSGARSDVTRANSSAAVVPTVSTSSGGPRVLTLGPIVQQVSVSSHDNSAAAGVLSGSVVSSPSARPPPRGSVPPSQGHILRGIDQSDPLSSIVMASSARDVALVRLRNGEHKRSAADLKRFVAECADHLHADELTEVTAAVEQRRLLSSLMLTPGFAIPDSDPSSTAVPSEGTLPVPPPSFMDFDKYPMYVDSTNSGVISAACLAYNSEILRWRLLGGDPLRSLALGVFTATTTPLTFSPELLRVFLLSQHSVFAEEKHELFSTPSRYLWSATDYLHSMGWLGDPLLFRSLAGAQFEPQGRSGETLLHPGHFYPGNSREEALQAYVSELDSRLTRGREILLNLVTCLAGVFLSPDLLSEFKRLNMEDKFSENHPRCSQEVLIAQFHRELQRCTHLLRRDLRANAQETSLGSGVLLKDVFRERGGRIAKWLMERLSSSLNVTAASGLTQARDQAVKFLKELAGDVGRALPHVSSVYRSASPALSSARSASPAISGPAPSGVPVSRPCVYAFLGKFCPSLGFKCAVGDTCSFSHSFSDLDGKSVKIVRSVVEGLPSVSNLGSRRPEILIALDALAL